MLSEPAPIAEMATAVTTTESPTTTKPQPGIDIHDALDIPYVDASGVNATAYGSMSYFFSKASSIASQQMRKLYTR